MMHYICKEDCEILRDDPGCPDQTIVIDNEGDILFKLEGEWTDDAVWRLIDIANNWYDRGHTTGMNHLRRVIKQLLNIDV